MEQPTFLTCHSEEQRDEESPQERLDKRSVRLFLIPGAIRRCAQDDRLWEMAILTTFTPLVSMSCDLSTTDAIRWSK
jgi:hypothetical protein